MRRSYFAFILALVVCLFARSTASAQPSLVKVSADRFTTSGFQHRTEVEPQTYTYGNAVVSAFQVGRVPPPNSGSEDIGFSTSLDGGSTWQHGVLPGITKGQNPNNRYDAVSDPSVIYDAAHGVWMIASLPLSSNVAPAVLISRSTDALHWRRPVGIAPRTQSADKDWITCDNTSTSPYFGHCYVEWDEPAGGDLIMMSTSTDGGTTWSSPKTTQNSDAGLGGEPLVQPDGTVIVPIWGGAGIIAFESRNGGRTWLGAVNVAQIFWNGDPGGVRSDPLPSTTMDSSGRIYVAWSDCRFRSNCASNDIVYTSSSDGTSWSKVTRVPIDPTSSSIDHLDPGFGVQPTTHGTSANIGLTFYFFSNVNCSFSTCQLGVGFIGSVNGGRTWDTAVTLAGPMDLSWLANSQNGYMVGDYITTSFVNSTAYSVFAVAKQPNGSVYDEAMYAPVGGLAVTPFGPQYSSQFDVARPDYRYLFHWHRIPPKKAHAEKEG